MLDQNGGRISQGPRKSKKEIEIARTRIQAKIKMEYDPDKKQMLPVLLLQLRSTNKPVSLSAHSIELDSFTSDKEFYREVILAAGILCEYNDEHFGDCGDATLIAQLAVEVVREVMKAGGMT